MRRAVALVFLALISFSCAPIGTQQTSVPNSRVGVFPSPYASDSDFLNLVNEDRAIRDQARRHVSVYYNCLIKTSLDKKRQDPMVLSGSRLLAFSEIPAQIYETRLERSAKLINEHNKAVMQNIVEKEITDLKKIKWDEIRKEVRLIVAGGRNAELEKYGCPISEAGLRRQQLRWFFEAPPFIPPTL